MPNSKHRFDWLSRAVLATGVTTPKESSWPKEVEHNYTSQEDKKREDLYFHRQNTINQKLNLTNPS